MTRKDNCLHPFSSLTFIMTDGGKYIAKIGCTDCNDWLFDELHDSDEVKT